jgi:hypothetical protein
MAERAKAIQESYEDRQTSTQEALDELFAEIRPNERRKREQAEKAYDALRYFVFTALQEAGVGNADGVSAKVAKAFVDHPNWQESEADLRELRKSVAFAVCAEMDDLDKVTAIVGRLLGKLISTAGGRHEAEYGPSRIRGTDQHLGLAAAGRSTLDHGQENAIQEAKPKRTPEGMARKKEAKRLWNLRNPDKNREYQRRSRAKHREPVLAYYRRYHAKHRERLNARKRNPRDHQSSDEPGI